MNYVNRQEDNVSERKIPVDESPINDFLSFINSLRISNPRNCITGSLNINSLRYKFPTIKYMLENALLDVLALCETKLDGSFPDGQFCIKEYTTHRKDRNSNGGGVMLIARSDLPQRRRHDVEKCIDDLGTGFEHIVVEITMNSSERWFYVSGYKPPNVSAIYMKDSLALLCDMLLNESANVVILGDYNTDFTNSNALTDVCSSFELVNLVTSPTCFKTTKGTLLDLCLVSNPQRFKKVSNVECWLSDCHNMICLPTKMSVPRKSPVTIKYRSYKHFVKEAYLNDLFDLFNIMQTINGSANDLMYAFNDLLRKVVDFHAPIKNKTIRHTNIPYMNGDWRKMCYRRNMMRNLKNKFPTQENFTRYKKLRNKCVQMRRVSQRKYFAERCDGGPRSKQFWTTIKPFINTKMCSNPNVILCENDTMVSDPLAVAKVFNKHFVSAASTIGFADPIPDNYYEDDVLRSLIGRYDNHPSILAIKKTFPHVPNFDFIETLPFDIHAIIMNLNPKKSTGYDNIPAKLLRIGAEPLSLVLSRIINKCTQEGFFPDSLKLAEVAALFKKLDMLNKDNYRPVSILTAISKIFERWYGKQITAHFLTLFAKFLSGFRAKHSCQSILLRMVEDWKLAIDSGKFVGAVAIDLSKAFDSLPHCLLIAKLHAYGVNMPSCRLLASYLHNRQQRVKIGNVKSDWMNISQGVPQGSILGPLLFNIFMNDIFYFIDKCDLYNYADDNMLSSIDSNVQSIKYSLSSETNVLMEWFKNNSLGANPSKFQSILLSGKSKNEDVLLIDVDNSVIESAESITVLGIDIDRKLNFNHHISRVCIKASKQLNVLKRLKGSLDECSRMTIYKTFIMSNFNYCPLIWMFTSTSSLTKIEDIQKRALRFVLNDYNLSYDELLRKAEVPGIKILLLRTLAIEMYKCISNENPDYLNELFKIKDVSYNLRDASIITRPKVAKSNFGLKSFKSFGAKIWNCLPVSTKSALSLQDFKELVKLWSGPKCKCTVCRLFT